MEKTIQLRGMTWNHTRGYLPLVTSAQRYEELRPEVSIVWEKRSLKDFEEYPIEVLAERYDLIVIDHPFVGYAAKHRPLLPLNEYVPESFLEDQAKNSVGASHESYFYEGGQWALAIDAAAPVAFWREDLLDRLGLDVPNSWEEMLALAKAGHVEIPAAPINCLMNFYMLCDALGETPFAEQGRVVSRSVGEEAMARLSELVERCDPACWIRNPIGSHDLVASTENETIAYCPLVYGYSNYAREGYADHRLKFGPPPNWGAAAIRSTLGGTGLAVSAASLHRSEAVDYARYCADATVQRCLSTPAGGQPGHREAWVDPLNNAHTRDYFWDTLPALDRAYLRPRYCGYPRFQEEGGPILHEALKGEVDKVEALNRLNALYGETVEKGV